MEVINPWAVNFFTDFARLWLKAFEFEFSEEKRLILPAPANAKNYIICSGENSSALFEFMAGEKNTCQIQSKDEAVSDFVNFLNREQQKNISYNPEPNSRGLFLGFPVLQLTGANDMKYLSSLFSIRIDQMLIEDQAQSLRLSLDLNLQEDSPLVYISNYLWNRVFQFSPNFNLDSEYCTVNSFRKWLLMAWAHILELNLGAKELAEKELSAQILFAEIFKQIEHRVSQIQTLNLLSDVNFLLYYKDNLQPTFNLAKDLNQLKKTDIWALTPSENLAHLFLQPPHSNQDFFHKSDYSNNQPERFIDLKNLSPSQSNVLKQFYSGRLEFVVGPPGNGKTKLLKSIALNEFCKHCYRLAEQDYAADLPSSIVVLIASLNNLAVDQALDWKDEFAIPKKSLPISIRMGSRESLSLKTLGDLEKMIGQIEDLEASDIGQLEKAKDAMLDIKSGFDSEEQALGRAYDLHRHWVLNRKEAVLNLLTDLYQAIQKQKPLKALYSEEKRKLFFGVFPVIGTTLLSIAPLVPCKPDMINISLIDEVSQALPIHILPVLYRSKKALLLGDKNQTQPIVKLRKIDWEDILLEEDMPTEFLTQNQLLFSDAKNKFSTQDYIENFFGTRILFLREHFRCHPHIINFCKSLCNYDLEIKSNHIKNHDLLHQHAFWYFDHTYSEERERTSWFNQEEAFIVIQILKQIIDLFKTHAEKPKITILTPYVPQKYRIDRLAREELPPIIRNAVQISTINAYQGQESDIVIFSGVLTQNTHRFLNHTKNLLNVAVSRASDCFIFVGALENLSQGVYTRQLYDALKFYGADFKQLIAQSGLTETKS